MLRRREGRMRAMRAFGLAAGVAAIMFSSAPRAQAQSNYPDRPIHIIVPYPPGGIVDIIARAVTEQVGRDWKQPVVVEAIPTAILGWSLGRRCWSIRPCTRTPAGTRCKASNASVSRSGIRAWRW